MAVDKVWKQLEFNQYDVYMDVSRTPPVKSHNDISPVREYVLKSLPKVSKVFMPFTFNGEPFWSLGIQDGYMNHPYEPFTILMYVLRERATELIEMIDGFPVTDQIDYDRVCSEFNSLFVKVKAGGGNGDEPGTCSVDEMIRMGALFYILQLSCCNKGGLILGEDGSFMNPWGRRSVILNLKDKIHGQYASKLRGIAMSGLDWQEFFFRYSKETDEDSLWFVNLPNVKFEGEAGHVEFSEDDLVNLLSLISSPSKRGGKVFILLEKTEEVEAYLKFVFKYHESGVFRTPDLNMYTNFTPAPLEYIAITNYDIETFEMRRTRL